MPVHLTAWNADAGQAAGRRGHRPAAVAGPGVPEPHRRPPVGRAHQRPPAAPAARLQRARHRLVRRVRPGSDLRRRAVQRVRPAVPAAARLPLRGRRGRGPVDVLAGEVAHRGDRLRHPGPRPAPRRRPEGHHHARHRLPRHPDNARAARGRRRRRPSTTPCCAWSTGCSSSSSPRTATRCTTPTPTTQARAALRHLLLLGPAARATPGDAGAPPTATSTRPCGSSSTRSATRTAAPSWACPASAASSTTPSRRPAARPVAVQRVTC